MPGNILAGILLLAPVNTAFSQSIPAGGYRQASPSVASGAPAATRPDTRARVERLLDSVAQYTAALDMERLYLHTDRTFYTAGDTVWLKGYLFRAAGLDAALKSGVLYLELADDSNQVVTRSRLPLQAGLTAGFIALDPKIKPGYYTLRGYTNWMRNFGPDQIFSKSIYVGSGRAGEDWLVRYKTRNPGGAGEATVEIGLKLQEFDGTPVGSRRLRLTVRDGKRNLLREEAETDPSGFLRTNLRLPGPDEPVSLVMSIRDAGKGSGRSPMAFPLALNRPGFTDVQFLPEGGRLVAGLPARVAFKALNEDGSGADVRGTVVDSRSAEVAAFASAHNGMGSFTFLPLAGETYSARVILPGGSRKIYPLPPPASSGMTLRVENGFGADSCEIRVAASPDIAAAGGRFYLVGQTRGTVCFGAALDLGRGRAALRISKDVFPSGVARISLLGPDRRVLNERAIYIDHGDRLKVRLMTGRQTYGRRDSVSVTIRVTDAGGNPVQGSFSLAVTDDQQAGTDSLAASSILTRTLLTADLKGDVEDPGYYAGAATDKRKWRDLDHLLLTQGWTGYDLEEAFQPPRTFEFEAEKEFLIRGTVSNAFNKPVANSGVSLFSSHPPVIADTVTDAEGHFVFRGIDPVDTAVYFIQARNKKGKSFNVGIEMEAFQPPEFPPSDHFRQPWFVNMDTALYLSESRKSVLRKRQEEVLGINMLEQVIVTGTRIIKGSKNLNGPGEADVIIDEDQLEKAGRTTLGDLLERNIPGFGVRTNKEGVRYYHINMMMAHLIIDGVETEFFLPEGGSLYEHLKSYFDYYDAEEIRGIEVMFSGKYQLRYASAFLGPFDAFYDHAFIEVTTRGGVGPFLKKMVGTFVFRPLPFTGYREFYSPRYTRESKPDGTDIRATLFWEPGIVTDENGRATIGFYAADHAGNYSLILEGSDMQGKVGAGKLRISVEEEGNVP